MFHRIEPVIRVTYHRSGLQNILFAAENMKFIKFVYERGTFSVLKAASISHFYSGIFILLLIADQNDN